MSERLPEHEPETRLEAAEAYEQALKTYAQIELIDHLLLHSDRLEWLQRTNQDGSLEVQGGVTVESLKQIRNELIGKEEVEDE